MNVEKICSPYTDIAALSEMLNNSHPDFVRGVYDMCAAFNYKADCPPNAAPAREHIVFVTPNGWVAGHLVYASDRRQSYDNPTRYFLYTSRAVQKSKGDARAERNQRAATKMKDLIKVLRMKREVITDENAPTYEHRAMQYAYGMVENKVDNCHKPSITIPNEAVAAFSRTVLNDTPLPEMVRAEFVQAYEKFKREQDKYDEMTASLRLFSGTCRAVGIFNTWGNKFHYFVGKIKFVKDGNFTKVEVQAPLKRYTNLADAGLATDAAIIRTYMEAQTRNDMNNELGLPRTDKYYDEIEVATGYSGDCMLWALLPEPA